MSKLDEFDWARIRARHEAFWSCDAVDGLVVQATAPSPQSTSHTQRQLPVDPEALHNWYTDPDKVIPRLRRQIESTYYAGDAFPVVFPVATSLVAIQAAFLGGTYSISDANGSAWCEPVIEDWADRKPLSFEGDNEWWRASKRLLAEAAATFGNSAAVGIPDLQGGGQILAQLRGTEQLALDLLTDPSPIEPALAEIDASWHQYWLECSRLARAQERGYVDWLGVWSKRPAVTVECDFCTLISPQQFDEHFLPSLARQTELVERTIYHLDGPGALRHLDSLLSIGTLNGIQWVPGAGAKPMRKWTDVLRRIQKSRKLLVLMCEPEDVTPLILALRPEGLILNVHCSTGEQADEVLRAARRHFR